MNTLTLRARFSQRQQNLPLPTTPRGRAIYTTDAFLNGRATLRNYDNYQSGIRGKLLRA